MIIKLTTGTTYNLANNDDFKRLKKNIYNMRTRGNPQGMKHIYHQVEAYRGYKGNNPIFIKAGHIAQNLHATFASESIPKPVTQNAYVAPIVLHNTITAAQVVEENKGEFKTSSVSSTIVKQVQTTQVAVQSLSTNEIKLPKQLRQYGNPAKAAIAVSYRNDQGSRMHGAFYDHYSMRKITEHETKIAVRPAQSITTLEEFHRQTTFVLGMDKNINQRVMPEIADNVNEGLLFIPGRPSNDKDVARRDHEMRLINQAYYRGQPILAVCAGSWRLWEAYGGTTRSIKGHLYSNMPYMVNDGGIGNNVQIHGIQLGQNTVLHGAMNLKGLTVAPYPQVNSIHWEAPDEKNVPALLQISATAVRDNKLAPKKNRQGEMEPEVGSVEGFESKHGAPHVGVVWHPEAYYKNVKPTQVDPESKRHLNLINYMAKAGDAYQAKRRMLQEFNQKASMSQLLKHKGVFRQEGNAVSSGHDEEKKNDLSSIYYKPK